MSEGRKSVLEEFADRVQVARAKQARAFYLEDQLRPPVAIFCHQFIAFGAAPGTIPAGYFQSPEVMTRHQVAYTLARMERIQDDFVPYLIPNYGTGVLASAFGAPIVFPENSDPAVAGPCITSLDDIERLQPPDPGRDGLMPIVLNTIDYMRAHSDLPVGLTDMQSTLGTCALLCGHSRLFMWMYDAPDKVHQLFEIVNQALIDWIVVQKKHISEPLNTVYGQLLCLPEGCGVVLSEDDAVSISPRHYREFCVPRNAEVFQALGGGMIHFCGDATHQIANFAQTEGLRGFHVIPLGNLDILAHMQAKLGDRMFLAAAEFMPLDPEEYYRQLLSRLNPRGLMLIPYVVETLRLEQGGYVAAENDLLESAERIYRAVERFYAA
jgi:uroporphyrinogen-III decarboxylase